MLGGFLCALAAGAQTITPTGALYCFAGKLSPLAAGSLLELPTTLGHSHTRVGHRGNRQALDADSTVRRRLPGKRTGIVEPGIFCRDDLGRRRILASQPK